MILGVAGVLAAGFGVAGCSGSSNVVDGTETAKVEDVAETVGQIEESTVAEVETSFSEAETEATVQETEGKYVYTILDGRVEVPCETRIEDYLEPSKKWPGRLRFDIYSLAEKYGWETNETVSQIWYVGPDGTELAGGHWSGASGNINGVAGESIIDCIGLGGSVVYSEQSTIAAEKAEYLTWNAMNSLTFDQIVLMTYAIEQETKNPHETQFDKLLTGVVYRDNYGNFHLDQVL